MVKEVVKNYLEDFVIIILAVVANIFGIFYFNQTTFYTIALSILVYLAFSVFRVKRLTRKTAKLIQKQIQKEQIIKFYETKESYPRLEDILKQAKSEIFIIAIAATTIIHSYLSFLEKKAKEGVKVKILIWQPEKDYRHKELLYRMYEHVLAQRELESQINSRIEQLKNFYNELSEKERKKVEMRLSDKFLTVSLIFIDKDKKKGFVQLQPILYRARPDDLPILIYKKSDYPNAFNILKKQYEGLWKESRPLI